MTKQTKFRARANECRAQPAGGTHTGAQEIANGTIKTRLRARAQPGPQQLLGAPGTQGVCRSRDIFRQTLDDTNHFNKLMAFFSVCVCNAHPHVAIIRTRCAIALRKRMQRRRYTPGLRPRHSSTTEALTQSSEFDPPMPSWQFPCQAANAPRLHSIKKQNKHAITSARVRACSPTCTRVNYANAPSRARARMHPATHKRDRAPLACLR